MRREGGKRGTGGCGWWREGKRGRGKGGEGEARRGGEGSLEAMEREERRRRSEKGRHEA